MHRIRMLAANRRRWLRRCVADGGAAIARMNAASVGGMRQSSMGNLIRYYSYLQKPKTIFPAYLGRSCSNCAVRKYAKVWSDIQAKERLFNHQRYYWEKDSRSKDTQSTFRLISQAHCVFLVPLSFRFQ